MAFKLLILLVGLISTSQSLTNNSLSDSFIINSINELNTTWKAGRNFDENNSMFDLTILLGYRENKENMVLEKTVFHDETELPIPQTFDARKQWSDCPTIGEIRDQGSCGSCWAFAAVEVMSDRVCIHSNQTVNFRFSAEDLLSCCIFCGYGCEGGSSDVAWLYWVGKGIVSGGPYESNEGCRPYEIPPNLEKLRYDTPKCIKKCQKNYEIPYEEDKKYGKDAYKINSTVEQIQLEIMKNGPVVASFDVYEDFRYYKCGVYQHHLGKYEGVHVVKILGWGLEKNTPYWLAANSWNYTWGDKGYFKILRGSDHLGIESDVTAGIPKYE